MLLFSHFLGNMVLAKIFASTNTYVFDIDPDIRKPKKLAFWYPIEVPKLHAFMAINLLMDLEKWSCMDESQVK